MTEHTLDEGEVRWEVPPAIPVYRTTHVHSQTRPQTLFGLDWSSDHHIDEKGRALQYVATAGGEHDGKGSVITIYEVEVKTRKGRFKPIQQYVDEDRKEHFYACAFAGRSTYLASMTSRTANGSSEQVSSEDESIHNSSSLDEHEFNVPRIISPQSCVDTNYLNHLDDRPNSGFGPKLLCVGGASNIIKVIDMVQQKTIQLLRGHNNDVYDLKGSPVDVNLLLSCSVDETIRLWNLESFSCVARFAGVHGHLGMVLSIAWHPSGDRFASSGHDSSIRLWNLHDGRVQEALRASQSLLRSDKRSAFKSVEWSFPYFVTTKVHRNVVDCVHFCGDMVLSKSSYNSIVLWQPKVLGRISAKVGSAAYKPPDEVILLRVFVLDHCGGLWFHRFTVDPEGKLLAIGNMQGEIYIWDLDSEKDAPSQKIMSPIKTPVDTIRNVAFNSESSILVACTDVGNVFKYHRTWRRSVQT